MRSDRPGQATRSTRRAIVRRGLATGTGLALAAMGRRSAADRSTPSATPFAVDARRLYLLVDPSWPRDRADDPALSIVALKPADEFAAAHLPGAVQIDWPALEVVDTSDDSLARWRGEVEQGLTLLGISRDATVVTYDGGTLFAARLWWILHYLGHAGDGNRVLDGGLAAWQDAGGELTDGAGDPATPAIAEPYRGDPQPDVLAQLAEVRAALADPDVVLVDARTPEEYAAGHIPGAVTLNYPLNAEPEPPATWKPVPELLAMYERIGVTPDKTIIPYCTSGVRSAVTFFTLRLIGYPRVALYTGSWQEWERVPGVPITTGDQP